MCVCVCVCSSILTPNTSEASPPPPPAGPPPPQARGPLGGGGGAATGGRKGFEGRAPCEALCRFVGGGGSPLTTKIKEALGSCLAGVGVRPAISSLCLEGAQHCFYTLSGQ